MKTSVGTCSFATRLTACIAIRSSGEVERTSAPSPDGHECHQHFRCSLNAAFLMMRAVKATKHPCLSLANFCIQLHGSIAEPACPHVAGVSRGLHYWSLSNIALPWLRAMSLQLCSNVLRSGAFSSLWRIPLQQLRSFSHTPDSSSPRKKGQENIWTQVREGKHTSRPMLPRASHGILVSGASPSWGGRREAQRDNPGPEDPLRSGKAPLLA